MGRFENEDKLLNDWGYRMKYAKAVCDAINKYLPEGKKIKDADIVKRVDNSLVRENYKKTNEFQEKLLADAESIKSIKIQPGTRRDSAFFTGTKEEMISKKNFLSTEKGAKEYIYNNLVKALESNPVKDLIDDENTMVNNFMKDPLKYASKFTIDSAILNQKLELHGETKDIFKNYKSLINGYNSYNVAFLKQMSPLNMLIPDDPYIEMDVIFQAMNDIAKIARDDPEAPSFLKDVDNTTKYATYSGDLISNKKITKELKELQDKGLPRDFMISAKLTVEGKEATFYEYMEATKAGKERGFVERKKEEIENIKEDLYSGKALSYSREIDKIKAGELKVVDPRERAYKLNSIFNKISAFSEDINKTNSVFSKDTEQFKEMRDLASNFAKEFKEANLDPNNEKAINEFYKNKKEDLDKIKESVTKYREMKEAKNNSEIARGKKLSSRSKDRFREAQDMEKFFDLNYTKSNLEYEEMKPEPYKDLDFKQKVVTEIQTSERTNDKVEVKELSKTAEKEMEMSGPDNK